MKQAQRIAILVPVTSRRQDLRRIQDCHLLRSFLPGFLETATWEDELAYQIWIGVDDDDPFYNHRENRRALLDQLRRSLAGRPATVRASTFQGTAHAPCWIWNRLFAGAYQDGADYFYQMGDDVQLLSAGWARSLIQALDSNPVLPGLGVAGPLEKVNRRILTQAFVSRVHHQIFETFFPEAFKNWWSDDWITEVYRPEHLFVCAEHEIYNIGGVERYQIDRAAESALAEEVSKGRERLNQWLTAHLARGGRRQAPC